MSQWFANFTTADWIALAALGTSVVGPLIVYWLGRRYTDKQFAVSNYPEVEFDVLVMNDEQLVNQPDKTVVPFYVQVTAKDITQVEAVNVRARITVATGLKQVWWKEPERHNWEVLQPYRQAYASLGLSLQDSIEMLVPNVVEKATGPTKMNQGPGFSREFLMLKSGTKWPRIFMLVEFSWSPPLRTNKRLSSNYLRELFPDIDNQEVVSWSTKGLSPRFVGLRMWRPSREELLHPRYY